MEDLSVEQLLISTNFLLALSSSSNLARIAKTIEKGEDCQT